METGLSFIIWKDSQDWYLQNPQPLHLVGKVYKPNRYFSTKKPPTHFLLQLCEDSEGRGIRAPNAAIFLLVKQQEQIRKSTSLPVGSVRRWHGPLRAALWRLSRFLRPQDQPWSAKAPSRIDRITTHPQAETNCETCSYWHISRETTSSIVRQLLSPARYSRPHLDGRSPGSSFIDDWRFSIVVIIFSINKIASSWANNRTCSSQVLKLTERFILAYLVWNNKLARIIFHRWLMIFDFL